MIGTNATPYDLRFRFLNIPVRVHPLFWLITACMGWQDFNLPMVALWVVAVFISILVHEYGHGLMAQHYGESPSILLYGLGGLCSSGAERTPGQRLAVLFAGPGAGFVLMAFVMAATSLLYGLTPADHLETMRQVLGLGGDLAGPIVKLNPWPVKLLYYYMVFINLVWGLVNLLPIYPLDGGQITQVVMTQLDRRHGARRSHIVSFVTAGLLAVGTLAYGQTGQDRNDYFLPFFFGMLAFLNYQVLQSYHAAHTYGLDTSDDSWRR